MSKLTETYRSELAAANAIIERGELTDADRADLDARMERLDQIKADVEREQNLIARGLQIASFPTEPQRLGFASNDLDFADLVRAHATGDRDILRAVTETNTGNIPGLIPEPVWGPMKSFIHANTPLWNSFTEFPMPSEGESFVRIYDPTNNGASVQSAQNAELASAALSVQERVVTITTAGHARKLSYQAIQRGNNTLALAQRDLLKGIARYKENYSATALVAASTNVTTGLSLTATAAQFESALFKAAGLVEDRFDSPADTVFLAWDRVDYLRGLADTTGRPMYPALSPMNADGTQDGIFGGINMPGARIVVSKKLPTNFVAVASSEALEKYNAPLGALQTTSAANLSVEMSLAEYIATCFWSQGIQRITV